MMKSGVSRSALAVGDVVFGIALLLCGLQLATDTELAVLHRTIAAIVLGLAGLLLLLTPRRARAARAAVRTRGDDRPPLPAGMGSL